MTNNDSLIEFLTQTDADAYIAINGGTSSQITEPDILPLTPEEIQVILAKKKREFGIYVAAEAIDLIGARNKILNLTGAQVTAMLTNLMSVKALLETGALSTARYYINQLKAAYPTHEDIFQDGIDDINRFEQEFGL